MAADFGRRFDELLREANEIEAKKTLKSDPNSTAGYWIDPHDLLRWQTKCGQLLFSVLGGESRQLSAFDASKKVIVGTNHGTFLDQRAIVAATKDDFEGGYLNSIRNLIQAAVFDTELEQADELLTAGYHSAAAVIAGVVLETTLRQMCVD